MDGIASEFQDLEERRLCDYVLYVSQDFLGISCQSTEGPLCPGVTNLIGSVGGGGGGGGGGLKSKRPNLNRSTQQAGRQAWL